MKTYFDLKNAPFDQALTQHHLKIKNQNKMFFIQENFYELAFYAILCFTFLLCFGIIYEEWINWFLKSGFGDTGVAFVYLMYGFCLPFGLLGGIIDLYSKFLKKINAALLPITRAECEAVLALRDSEGHEELRNYINTVVAQRELYQWELKGLKDAAAQIKRKRDEEEAQKITTRKSEAEIVKANEACAQLYVHGNKS